MISDSATRLIKSWKFSTENQVFMIKRSDGIQYFKMKFKRLSTLPKCELQRLSQIPLINPSRDSRADFIEVTIRREMNSKRYNLLKPTLGMIYKNKKKLDPVTRRPIVKIIYPPAKCLKKIPLEILPLDILRRLQYWEFDEITGEAEIVYIPNDQHDGKTTWGLKRERLRVFDPLCLINLSEQDLKILHSMKILFKAQDQIEAAKFQKVVDICVEKGIHAGGVFPADWK